MTPLTDKRSFAPEKSLRVRMLFAISSTVLLMFAGCVWFLSQGISRTSLVQIRHEGLLLANTVEAAVGADIAAGDMVAVQAYIDRLVSRREKNDLEVNVTLLAGEGAVIAASNVPDNIEAADEDDLLATWAALRTGEPALEVEVEDDDDEEPDDDDDEAYENDPTHPDYYFPEDSRLLSITTPMTHDGVDLGSINIKLSLLFLDQEMARLMHVVLLAMALGSAALAGLLTPFLTRTVFRPLTRLSREMYAFGIGEDIGPLVPTHRRDEIGVLRTEFFNMVARVKSAEAMREELARVRAERKEHELEAKLRQAQKMEALGTLAGGIAHDFNNILTPILGYSEILMAKLPEGSELQSEVDEINRAAERAKDLVRQILTFSRRNDDEQSPLQVGPIVKETLKFLRASIPANIEVRRDIQGGDAMVMGSPTHLHQVVLNLATNACQAMIDEGGRLDVGLNEVTIQRETDINGAFKLIPGRFLKLTVADTGPGIQPHVVDRIFEPYFTTKEEGKGTGLGLATVHGIIHDMGGGIAVGSEPGKGARFEVYLPIAEVEPESELAGSGVAVDGGGERILVVDDEELISRMMGKMLSSLGYDVSVFSSPADALEYVAGESLGFDLIISDVAMPGMTGIEFVKELAATDGGAPVILCSAYAGGINWKMAWALGIKAIIMKPIRLAELASSVREVLDGGIPCAPETKTCVESTAVLAAA